MQTTQNKTFTRHSAGGIIINQKNEIVLVKQGSVSWSFPKGHLEKDETPLEAAKREILEETGIKDLILEKELESYVRTSDVYTPNGIEVVNKKITLFVFKTSQEEVFTEDDITSEIKWVNKNLVTTILTHPKDKAFYTEEFLTKLLIDRSSQLLPDYSTHLC
ncbi:MAG: NUDIX domain-containing protein [bacterium]